MSLPSRQNKTTRAQTINAKTEKKNKFTHKESNGNSQM